MLHSGSRNIGNTTANHYDKIAAEQLQEQGIKVPSRLHYPEIDSEEGQKYLQVCLSSSQLDALCQMGLVPCVPTASYLGVPKHHSGRLNCLQDYVQMHMRKSVAFWQCGVCAWPNGFRGRAGHAVVPGVRILEQETHAGPDDWGG